MSDYSLRRRVLVTGGAGFTGSHLCDRLIAEGNERLCVDNSFTGARDNIAHLIGKPGFALLAPRRHLPADGRLALISPSRPRNVHCTATGCSHQ